MIGKREIKCGNCKYNRMRTEIGHDAFANGCRPEACPLYEFETFENAPLWKEFEELIQLQSAGLGDIAALWFAEFDLEMIRAFVMFRSVLLASTREARNG